ncbi:TetR/AcrR family transcriptional regulator [Nocardioides marinquilinus]|uniref:TetR/AcrR family transcriptional regulator n=1 Tax=Nocardioides marinquilinus TaxID=1210400 RepID=UPI0031E7445F
MSGEGTTRRRAPRTDAVQNRERLARAAVAAIHREGLAVPMATIAKDAGVGVGTVYRNHPTRDDLLDDLTRRSFELMLTRIEAATDDAPTAVDALRGFLTAVVGDRDAMLLPSTGGPAPRGREARAAQRELHTRIRALLDRGAAEGSIRREVEVADVAWLGATLAQPGRPGPTWDRVCRRLLETYLAGLATP